MTRQSISWMLVGLLVLTSLSSACASPTSTNTAQPTPRLTIHGHVWLDAEGEIGLADVKIYRKYASYLGVLAATTDQDGYYQFDLVLGDEMVTVWAELEGYVFEPEQYAWRHYSGYESRTLNFVATCADC